MDRLGLSPLPLLGRPLGRPLRIGLTGGIGSGKSTVARELVALGAVLVDTDAIARSITAPGGAALPALKREFGDHVVDTTGALDRARMRELAFGDVATRKRLESVLHPLIGEQARAQAAAAGTDAVVVFDVPLLAESAHWRARCERIVVVDCGEATQVRRVVQRSGWAAEQVRVVIAQQAPRERRRAIADAVIHNDGVPLDEIRAQVLALWAAWIGTP